MTTPDYYRTNDRGEDIDTLFAYAWRTCPAWYDDLPAQSGYDALIRAKHHDALAYTYRLTGKPQTVEEALSDVDKALHVLTQLRETIQRWQTRPVATTLTPHLTLDLDDALFQRGASTEASHGVAR